MGGALSGTIDAGGGDDDAIDYGVDATFGAATIDRSDPANVVINDTNYFDH